MSEAEPMREIKFRAWKVWNKGNHKLMLRHEDFIEREETNPLRRKGVVALPLIDPEYIFMQFTGLKDKNGKEIYEGDIIFHKRNTAQGLIDAQETIQDLTNLPDFSCSRQLKIVGNIYENPELLK